MQSTQQVKYSLTNKNYLLQNKNQYSIEGLKPSLSPIHRKIDHDSEKGSSLTDDHFSKQSAPQKIEGSVVAANGSHFKEEETIKRFCCKEFSSPFWFDKDWRALWSLLARNSTNPIRPVSENSSRQIVLFLFACSHLLG